MLNKAKTIKDTLIHLRQCTGKYQYHAEYQQSYCQLQRHKKIDEFIHLIFSDSK